MLMMSADHDDRVDPMHARKFTAAVQSAERGNDASGSQQPGVAWLRIEMHSGHGGADQVGKAVESSVDQLAFLMGVFAMKPPAEQKAAPDAGMSGGDGGSQQ
jgi:prolyl oligopeptidase